MGKGDKKSKKGKISMGSYGVRRPKKKAKKVIVKPKKETVKKVVADAVPEKKVTKPKASKKKEE